ncbi:CATRA conflict system CASPASE/TPR repeat-associated protein [Streptomyces sp. NPDC051217]|uniref:CATRA conflict system CASPASE/TPR repeat-associated protein n=1 Tax=Streptomyces sp. NPDC051217 TaxID=3365644 RepID=UPI0037953693
MLQAEALGVHVFVATGGKHRHDALAFLRDLWDRCGETLQMTEPIPGVGVGTDPAVGWQALLEDTARGTGGTPAARGLIAARTRSGPGVWQAALRREHDALCLSVMLAPDPAEGLGWAELDTRWTGVVRTVVAAGRPGEGVLGTARLYLARLADPAPSAAPDVPSPEPAGPLTAVIRTRTPAAPSAADAWPFRGVVVPQGFAVWEASAAADTREERRLAVIATHDRDPELTAWAWTTRTRELPPLGRYLQHSARLRHQLRVWTAAEGIGLLRARTDVIISELLARSAAARHGPHRPSELLSAAHALTDLQARERGLVDRLTRIGEMARTVEIAAANMSALSGDPALGGPFADDRALSDWFAQRLDDEATYLEAALRRCERAGTFADQLVQRDLQRRQETFNLGLTGAVGAILMSLAAVQSLQYTVPLPGVMKPAVVTALGSLALLASLVVLRVVMPDRRWPLVLVRMGAGALGGALAWVVVSAVGGDGVTAPWTAAYSGLGAVVGVAAATKPRPPDRG